MVTQAQAEEKFREAQEERYPIMRAVNARAGEELSPSEFGAQWYRSAYHTEWYAGLSPEEKDGFRKLNNMTSVLRRAQDPAYARAGVEASTRWRNNHLAQAQEIVRIRNLRVGIGALLDNPYLPIAAPAIDLAAMRALVAGPADEDALREAYARMSAALEPFRTLNAAELLRRAQLEQALPHMNFSETNMQRMAYHWGLGAGEYALPHTGIATGARFGVTPGRISHISLQAIAKLPPIPVPPLSPSGLFSTIPALPQPAMVQLPR